MASGRPQSDCFSGAGNNLDSTVGWGLCIGANRGLADCTAHER